MKSKYLLRLRPKYALWLLVALLGSTWYVADPQARPGQASREGVRPSDPHPNLGFVSAHRTHKPLVASTTP